MATKKKTTKNTKTTTCAKAAGKLAPKRTGFISKKQLDEAAKRALGRGAFAVSWRDATFNSYVARARGRGGRHECTSIETRDPDSEQVARAKLLDMLGRIAVER